MDSKKVKEIIAKLPISYYTASEVDDELRNKLANDYLDKSDIVYELNHHKWSDDDCETIIRSGFYSYLNELAIAPNISGEYEKLFEKRRLEYLTQNFYLDVDFQKTNRLVNTRVTDGSHLENVLYGLETDERAIKIFEEFKDITKDSTGARVKEYRKAVQGFIASANQQNNDSNNDSNNGDSSDDSNDGDSSDDSNNKSNSKSSKSNDDSNNDENNDFNNEEDKDSNGDSNDNDGKESNNNGNKEFNNNENNSNDKSDSSNDDEEFTSSHSQSFGEMIADKFRTMDEELTSPIYNQLATIIANFNKKNKGGNGSVGFSGVFNARNCVRDDYRYFDRKCNSHAQNTFGTVHLNIFCDVSGSYTHNVKATNQIFRALDKIERSNPNFSWTLIKCGYGQEIVPRGELRRINAWGSTALTQDIFHQFRTVQLPQTYNYNIVMYDGNCYHPRAPHAWSCFNKVNCAIISDKENERDINDNVTSAHVQIIKDNYPNKLGGAIISAFERAFR